jgi:Mrp family chromosome partitioning ATPase
MGRMADIWKSTDRGPATPLPHPSAVLALDAAGKSEMTDDDVPFIEVGGPHPVMKHLESIAPKAAVLTPRPEFAKGALPVSPVRETPAIMTVQFEAVRAAHLSGRGFGPELIAFHQPTHAVSVQYRSLMAEIMTQLPGAKPRMLLFVAAEPNVGTTTVALNLGVTLARQEGVRAILVDAHFAQPDLAERLGLPASPGLHDVLARETPLAWSIQETIQTNLFALTAARDEAPPAAALAPIVEQLRSRNDWILLDAGPWDDRLVPLAEVCDAIYLVHAENDAASSELIGAIVNATGRLRGCIVTRK